MSQLHVNFSGSFHLLIKGGPLLLHGTHAPTIIIHPATDSSKEPNLHVKEMASNGTISLWIVFTLILLFHSSFVESRKWQSTKEHENKRIYPRRWCCRVSGSYKGISLLSGRDSCSWQRLLFTVCPIGDL